MKKYISILIIVFISCESSSDLGLSGGRGETSFTAGSDSNTGIGGSMARFTIVNDYLYIFKLDLFKIYVYLKKSNFIFLMPKKGN